MKVILKRNFFDSNGKLWPAGPCEMSDSLLDSLPSDAIVDDQPVADFKEGKEKSKPESKTAKDKQPENKL